MKKKIIIVFSALCLCAFALTMASVQVNPQTDNTHSSQMAAVQSKTIYVSPTGTAAGAGTEASPKDFSTTVINAEPGTNVLMLAGTYEFGSRINISANGTYNGYINVRPATTGSRVILDFSKQKFDSTNRGIQLTGDYWHFYGIEVTGAGDNGMYVAGSNNIIEFCQFYKNRDTGLQIGRGGNSDNTIDTWPSNNLIKNCTSFDNYDEPTLGENADGFAAKLTVGYGNVFDGCIAYRNSDDGWDLYAKEDSGNIGTVALYNCVSFENGFLPDSHEGNDGNQTFNTVNGDGIGFKLGGSTMEGDVYVENCLAFNNKLHGFGDNSNPGVIQMKNCTAINNCIGLNEDGTVSAKRGVEGSTNKSNNFDLARDTNSYNTYYGLLSYINNQIGFTNSGDNSYNADAFRGTTAYSIFQTSYNSEDQTEEYLSVGSYMDASSYADDALAKPTTKYTGLSDASFANIAAINAIGEKATTLHTLFRNEDESVNLGDIAKVVDENLLSFADGKAIGANLSKTTYADYPHFNFSDTSNAASEEAAILQNAYDVLDVLADKDAIFQDFELSAFINGCEVAWTSSNEQVLKVNQAEKLSISSAAFITISVLSPQEQTTVTLTATLSNGDLTMNKTFTLTVMPRDAKLGEVVSSENDTTYIVQRYQTFRKPTITVTDASSISKTPLDPALYDLSVEYDYAENRDGAYVEVDDIYTSVPGVFRVTTTATSKIPSDEGKSMEYVYYVYIGADECDIDFVGGIHSFSLNSTGFNISATLSNIAGKLYAVVTDADTILFEASEVVNHANAQVYNITSDSLAHTFAADNSSGENYKVFYVLSDKVGKNFSNIYSKSVTVEEITTHQEFYNLAQGITTTNALTIYNLANDLDFSDYEWIDAPTPKAFLGTFNGNGYTISNVTVNTDVQKNANLFYKLEGGTIMNTNFENISITNTNSSAKLVGIIGGMNGGYVSNINIKNVTANATQSSSGSVGGLIGQIVAGVNYIDHITLENNDTQIIRCGNKYAAGIIGNIQLDSGYSIAKTYVSYCVVKANIGDGSDSGGCVGGIVGRTKNDNAGYYLDVNNCYYVGTIKAKGNYNGGIVGDISSGVGKYNISNNFADVVFIYSAEKLVLDAKLVDTNTEYQEYAHKNCNPIAGRANSLTGEFAGVKNLGSWAEYYSKIISSISLYFIYGSNKTATVTMLKTFCDWDFENDWQIVDGVISLR